MKQETIKHLADGATISAVSSGASSYFGWFTFINENAAGIGVILSFLFGVTASVFYCLTWRKATLANENKKEIVSQGAKLDLHIDETREEFRTINNGVQSILRKIS